MQLDRPIVRMPEFEEGVWLNTPGPQTQPELRGKVVLVDFWDYTCLNCLRTFPYLKEWHRRYVDKGLAIVGVHTPEFRITRVQAGVEKAVAEYELEYPILLDNSHKTWDVFANKAWPSKHLVDARGYVRLRRQGEGHYQEMEQAIQTLLRGREAGVDLPPLLPPLRREDAPGAVCYRPTPELHAGFQGGGLFGGALGNKEGYVSGSPMIYSAPDVDERREGRFYLDGFWWAEPEAVVYAGSDGGRVYVPFHAAGVNVVMSPSSDPVDLILGLRKSEDDPVIEVALDGAPLRRDEAGEDVQFDEEARSYFTLPRAKMVRVWQSDDFRSGELELVLRDGNVALYAISFSGCLAPDGAEAEYETYRAR